MDIIEKISRDTSEKLGERLNKTEEEKSVLNYGLFIIIHTLIAIILTFLIGLLTNNTLEIMTITLSAAWMKRYSGGAHATSPNRCLIIGVIVSLILSYLCKLIIINMDNTTLLFILVIGMIISFIILYNKCPVGTKNKPLTKVDTRRKLRKNAFKLINFYSFLIAFGLYIYVKTGIYNYKVIIICIFIGLILQISMITKFGNYIIIKVDDLLKKLKI